MRSAVASALALLAALAACSGACPPPRRACCPLPCTRAKAPGPTAAEVLKALRSLEGLLAKDQAGPGWLLGGLDPYREGLAVLEKGEAKPLSRDDLVRRVREADVVLVADLHDHEVVRQALARLLVSLADPAALAAGRVALVLETVALDRGDAVDVARKSGDAAAVRARLDASWSWPLAALVDLLLDARLAAVPVLGAGRDAPAPRLFVPGAGPDAGPGYTIVPSLEDWKYGVDHYRRSALAAGVAFTWVRADGPRRQAWVLYGAAHLLGATGRGDTTSGHAEALGLRVVTLVPFLPEWERAVREKGGPARDAPACEVLPGVLRVDAVPPEEVLAAAKEDARHAAGPSAIVFPPATPVPSPPATTPAKAPDR